MLEPLCVQVAIVGGGLAGLATAHHLLQLLPSISVTIFDPREPGKAEASSVAGKQLDMTPTLER